MFCQKCGSQLDDSAKFCIVCGAPVENQPAPEAQGCAPYAEPATDAFVYAPVADAASEPANNPFVYAPPTDVAPAPAPKKKSAKKIIIPIVAVVVAAAIAVGVYFGFFANKKYYISTMTQYTYDEDGNIQNTVKTAYYGKFMFPLEMTFEGDEEESALIKFELDDDEKIIKFEVENIAEAGDISIDIEYEKEDGKQVGTGSYKNDNGKKQTLEIVYESDDEFTLEMKSDGETAVKATCYINDDGNSVMEYELLNSKQVSVYDGSLLVESKSYSREDTDDDFELTSSTENTYNKKGFLIESVRKHSYDDEDYTYKTVYERDKNNVPTSITKYEDGEKVSHSKIDKEDDDKIVLEILDQDDDVIRYEEYGFDGKKLTYTKTYNEDHELTSEATYNKNGLVEEEIEYYEDGEISSKTVYEYEKR